MTSPRFGLRAVSRLAVLVGLLPWIAAPAVAEENTRATYIRSHYTKFEYRIPMRDGVRLFTAVYVPNDVSKTYPLLMMRTPYSVRPYGADRYRPRLGPTKAFEKSGFIFVLQDVRGRYMSEGTFVNMRPHLADKKSSADVDESTDTWDTIEWLLEHVEGHNGRVGQRGISYPGFYTSAGMIDSHPALAAASPQAPIADWWWDDMHRHGAFVLPLAFNFFSSFGQPRPEPTTERPDSFDHESPDGYDFFLDLGPLSNVNERHFKGEVAFWNDLAAHPDYDDFWQSRNILPHLKNVGAAVLVVGGWYDTEDLYGPLATYASVERQNPDAWNVLVMGPWRHGGWARGGGDTLGDADFGFRTSDFYAENVELPFFEHFLKDQELPLDLPEALMFETGANRWRRFDAWPPENLEPRRLYLHGEQTLAFEPPTDAQDVFDDYVADPAKPVPYTMQITTNWAKEYMTEDQRFAAWRPDVLVYESEVLEEDLTIAGPIQADLFVSTSGTAADFVVKLVDVFPSQIPGRDEDDEGPDFGGAQRLVRAEVFRGRFRNSYEQPEPFVPDEVARVSYPLHDVLHTFKRGHRLMVQVQSSWFPFIDRNPQTFVPNIFEAKQEDFVKATMRVHRSATHASSLAITVLPSGPRTPSKTAD